MLLDCKNEYSFKKKNTYSKDLACVTWTIIYPASNPLMQNHTHCRHMQDLEGESAPNQGFHGLNQS